MSTAWEKFRGATLSLARSGPIKDRLTDAYRKHLSLIDENELPRELRAEFRAVHESLTREPPLLRGEDAFRATIRKMSLGEAEEIATSVVRMFSAIPRNYAPPPRAANAAQVVPFLTAEA